MFENLDVLQENIFGLDRGVSLFCSNPMMLVFISPEAVEKRFERKGLQQNDSNLLVSTDLASFKEIIVEKHTARRVEKFAGSQGKFIDLIKIDLDDIEKMPPIMIQSEAPETMKRAKAMQKNAFCA